MKYRLDQGIMAAASEARDREYRQALFDLNVEEDGKPPLVTVRSAPDGGVVLVVDDEAGAVTDVHVPHAALASCFREYRDIIQRLVRADGGSFGMRDYETLDMAKKLVHDEAGDVLQRALRAVHRIEHAAARRLFTLVFLATSDLPEALIRGHRRHGLPQG